jgi:hypothetical protein
VREVGVQVNVEVTPVRKDKVEREGKEEKKEKKKYKIKRIL